MPNFTQSLVLLAGLLACGSNAFAPTTTTTNTAFSTRSTASVLNMLPVVDDVMQSSDVLTSMTDGSMGEITKSAFIVLLFGGGLIPAAIAANTALLGTLSGKRRGGEEQTDNDYIYESGASGPTLPSSAFLFASETIPLVDIIAVLGRIDGTDSICDWRNLPTTKVEGANPNNPVMWLPRGMFKENMRSGKFYGWPTDPVSGEPLGGKELEQAEKGRISKKGAVIGDAALDAVFDSWAWGASVATPDKVEKTLAQYQKGRSIDLGEFTGAAIRGRSITGLGALTFIVIQVVAYGSLFIAPALRVIFDIDIGLGVLGQCDGVCKTLF